MSSRASRAKIITLRIKAEFQQKRAQQQLDAERHQIEADLKMKRQQIEADLNMERQHREAQLQASHRERELTQLQIEEELAIAVAEDTILNDLEDSAFPMPLRTQPNYPPFPMGPRRTSVYHSLVTLNKHLPTTLPSSLSTQIATLSTICRLLPTHKNTRAVT